MIAVDVEITHRCAGHAVAGRHGRHTTILRIDRHANGPTPGYSNGAKAQIICPIKPAAGGGGLKRYRRCDWDRLGVKHVWRDPQKQDVQERFHREKQNNETGPQVPQVTVTVMSPS